MKAKVKLHMGFHIYTVYMLPNYVTQHVLVASLPLYQPVEPATQLGYEVHVYAHVPYTSNGLDRVSSRRHHHSQGRSSSGSGSGSSGSMNAAKEYTCWLSSSIVLATDLSKPATSSSSATPVLRPIEPLRHDVHKGEIWGSNKVTRVVIPLVT